MVLGYDKQLCCVVPCCLGTLTTDAAGQLDILGHDGNTLSVNGAQVGVFKETDQVGLRSFLQGHDGRGLETQVSLEVLGDLPHQALEGQLPDEQLSALLVATDLTQGNGTWPVAVRFLDTACSRGRLASCLGGQLLTRGLASRGFTGSLFGTSHDEPAASEESDVLSVRVTVV